MINTSLVKKDEVKAYRDLLNPKWKGKILIDDPTILGGGNRWAMFIGEYFPELGWDFQRELARQEPTLLRDRRLMAQWLTLGKYSIYLGPHTEVRRMIDAGAPIAVVYPKEGTYGSSGHGSVAFYDKAPNPNAAQVFANWFLTREGQTVYSRARMKQSMRTDVPIDHLPPEETREHILKAGGAFINPPDEEFSEIRKKRDSILQDIWSPLVGR